MWSEIETPDGPMMLLAARPEHTTRGAVIVLMEAFGVNAHIQSVCQRFASLGYTAIAPDLYHRSGQLITGPYDDPGQVMPLFAELTTDGMASDLGATFDHLAADGIASGDVGVIGFCLGGYGAVLAACRRSPGAVAGFYGAGVSLRRDGSPLDPLAAEFPSIDCPVQLFYGAEDPVIPTEEVERTRDALRSAGADAEVHVYDGAGHGFFCDERAAYRPDAATDAWERVIRRFGDVFPRGDESNGLPPPVSLE